MVPEFDSDLLRPVRVLADVTATEACYKDVLRLGIAVLVLRLHPHVQPVIT